MSPFAQIAVAGVGTYVIRVSVIVLVGRGVTIPPRLEQTLRLIAPAVLSAIVADTIFLAGGGINTRWSWYLAGAVAAVVSWRTRSAGYTVLVGLGIVWGASALL